MSDAIRVPSAKWPSELRITTNRGGDRIFLDLRQLREFSVETADDLATLTAVIGDSNLDAGFVMQTIGLLNDLAFQLQQAVALMCGPGAPENGKEPVNREARHG